MTYKQKNASLARASANGPPTPQQESTLPGTGRTELRTRPGLGHPASPPVLAIGHIRRLPRSANSPVYTGLGDMQPDIDAQLSNFFEETPQRDFARVMRGYDPHQVNEYLKQVDGDLRQHRDQAQALQQELTDAHRQLQEQERTTYAGLGSRIEQLLRLAEEQATEIVQEARTGANELN